MSTNNDISQGVPSVVSDAPPDLPGIEPSPNRSALRRKLLVAALIAMAGLGASVMSCVGQAFSYRQAHALEGIEEQLKEIRASCPAFAPAFVPSPPRP